MSKTRRLLIISLSVLLVVSASVLAYNYIIDAKAKSEISDISKAMKEAKADAVQKKPVPTPQPAPSAPVSSVEPVATPEPEPVMLTWLESIYESNTDLCGWLYVNEDIDYPVMYTPEDPQHYLRTNFNGEHSIGGTLFVDAACDPFEPTLNIIIYGHNMRAGTMFAKLMLYSDYDYWKSHRIINFDTLYEERTYEVIAAFFGVIVPEGKQGFRYYAYLDIQSEEDYDEYIENIKALSEYDTGLTAEYGDELLTLSTCSHVGGDRFVVVARRIDDTA